MTPPSPHSALNSNFPCDCDPNPIEPLKTHAHTSRAPLSPCRVGFDSIYYDEDGNMRVGAHGRVRKGPKGEFERVLRLDDGTKSDEGRWCIVESGWVSSWLAFVYYNDSSPAPGMRPMRAHRMVYLRV